MLLHEREYFIGDELTLISPEFFLINYEIKFLWISEDIMQELKREFVSINIPELSRFW